MKRISQSIALAHAASIAVFLLSFGTCLAQGAEREKTDSNFEYLRQLADAIKIRPAGGAADVTEFAETTPVLRFGDATRETSDGVIWKIGRNRPLAVVAMEIVHKADHKDVNYEFLCLTEQKFEMVARPGWSWKPSASALTMKPLNGVPAPSLSKQTRLRQLKQLARRFEASEVYVGQNYRLRLMPQPIDQYVVDGRAGLDGAVFAFAHGTNPEVLLLLEATDNGWQFGFARLCGAAPQATFDGRIVWTKPAMDEIVSSWTSPYMGDAYTIDDQRSNLSAPQAK
ncbi:hypothetical protein Enr13x_48640 [Stieleria neptunia]|uniref:Uncharacterized protein n=1 Tax=Stieleria neptunia TaxID=2527979 RepID=A0A518HVW4_9BACT|nr:hypothetical protein [Stieleria neptunia]QDV44991.1 hypothetical protein Enr13x_48640 [Stieleria neptunia]